MIRGVYYQMLEHPDRTHGNSVFSDEYETAITALIEGRFLSDRIWLRSTKAISKAQISEVTYESVKLWVEEYEAYMKEKGYKFQNVMNVDEMRIKLQKDNSQSRKLESTLIARPGEVKGGR
ncbi:hypothetical protein HDU99_008670, partial [Rhizoclosmatium hyalinum]